MLVKPISGSVVFRLSHPVTYPMSLIAFLFSPKEPIRLQINTLCPTTPLKHIVVKMASHAIFQYNVLAIDDTHNTWTNMIVKINIPRLLGSSDDKEKIGAARPEGPPLRGFRKKYRPSDIA